MINTPRLHIVPFADRHLTAAYVGWLNDPALMRFSEQRHRAHTPESCKAYLRSFAGTANRFMAIESRSGLPKVLGTATIYVDVASCVADIGILIGDPSAHGTGLGTEAWVGLMAFAFERLGARKVSAGTLSVNLPMLRVFRKAGMKDDGRRLRHALHDGVEVDVVYAASLRGDWTPPVAIELDPAG